MIDVKEIIPDPLSDEVGILLTKLKTASPGIRRESARAELKQAASREGYIFFVGNCNRYILHRLGDTYFYRVPTNKRGNLKVFRGKLVRICCWHAGNQFERNLMAGVVKESDIE